jgi:signal transduction histidine kinase
MTVNRSGPVEVAKLVRFAGRAGERDEANHDASKGVPAPILVIDRAFRCSFANEMAHALFAAAVIGETDDGSAGLVGRAVYELVGEQGRGVAVAAITTAFAGTPMRFAVALGNGKTQRTCQVTCVPQPLGGGAVESLLLIFSEPATPPERDTAVADTQLLYQLTNLLHIAPTLTAAHEPALDLLTEGFGVEHAAIHIADQSGRLRCCAHRQLSEAFVQASELGVPFSTQVIHNRQTVQLIGIDDEDGAKLLGNDALAKALRDEGIAAALWAPVVSGEALQGMLALYSHVPRVFDDRDRALARAMAAHFATAVTKTQTDDERSRLIDELTRTIHLNELFTGILGHDLRNPLQSMLTAAEILIRRTPDPKVATTASRIVTSGNRMNRMIEQLLDFTRIRAAGTVPIERSPTDVAAVWRQSVEEFASKGAIRVQFEYRGETQGQWDPDRLAQVASNLIANAIRHGSPNAPVAIEVDGTDPTQVQIHVHNEGVIPDLLLPRLFEPFQSGDRLRSRGDGLGLGLFITRQIVEAHGGTLEVVSSPACGTEFTVRLPRPLAREPEIEAPSPSSAAPTKH